MAKEFSLEEALGTKPVVSSPLAPAPASAPIEFSLEAAIGAPASAPALVATPVVAPTPATAPVVAAKPADTLEAKEAKRKEFGFGEEFGKGAKGAVEYGLPSMGRQLALQGSADAMMTRKSQLELMNKIDQGAYKNLRELQADPVYESLRADGQNMAMVGGYFTNRSQPEIAAKLRGSTEKEFRDMAADTRTHIDMLNKYARENKAKYGPRVEKFTDIDWTSPQVVADFTNWLGSSMGAGAVQLAPVMLAAVTLKQPGLLAASGAMGVSEAVGNRMKFIKDKTKGLSPDEQGAAIAKYVAETGDANLITGVISGSLDLILGPAATAAKLGLSKAVGEVGKGAAMKKAVKELPKDIRGEAITGGLQETTQIAAKKLLEEQGLPVTMDNIKDVVNAMAAEAAGAPVGTAVNVALAGMRTPSAAKAAPVKERIEPTFSVDAAIGAPAPAAAAAAAAASAAVTAAAPAPAPAPAPVSATAEQRAARVAELAKRIEARGFNPEEAADAAELRVATEERSLEARQEAAAKELPTYYPKVPKSQQTVEDQLFYEYLDEGLSPEQARELAKVEADKRKEDAKTAAQQGRNIKKGKKDVAGLDTAPTGAGVPVVAEQPAEAQPTGDLEGVERGRVVPAESDAERTTERTVPEPTPLTAEELFAKADEEDRKLAAAAAPAPAPAPKSTYEQDVKKRKQLWGEVDSAKKQLLKDENLASDDPKLLATKARLAKAEAEEARLVPELSARINAEIDKSIEAGQQREAERVEAEREAPAPAAAAAIETDAAITEAQAPATEPKAKRGRKADPEEVRLKKKEEQDRLEAVKTKADYELSKGKKSLVKMIDDASAPVDQELTADEVEKAEDDKRQDKRYAVRRLVQLAATPELRGTAVGKRINALLANRTKISQQEIDDAKRGIAVAAQALADKSNVLGPTVDVQGGTFTAPRGAAESRKTKVRKANKRFVGTMSGGQALSIIAQTGTWFERLIANRIRKFIGNVQVVVLEKGQPLPAALRDANESPEGRWNGLFMPGTKPVVYITGESFGALNGQNNITILHELLHAALNGRLFAGMGGYSAAAKVFTDQIIKIMERARLAYAKMDEDGTLPEALRARVESTLTRDEDTGKLDYEIFSSPDEFLSYTLSENVMQDFLKSIPSMLAQRAANAFTDFVRSAAKVLGLGEGKNGAIEVNALTDIIEATDSLLDVQFKEGLLQAIDESLEGEVLPSVPPEEQKPGQFSATASRDVRTQQELKKDVAIALNKVEQSRDAEEMAETSMLANVAANPAKFVPELMSLYDAADRFGKRLLLNLATTDYLAEEWGGSQVPRLKEVNRFIQEMHGMQARLMEGASKVSNVIFNEFYKDSDIRTPTENMALVATLAEIDPSTDTRSPEMNTMWNALPAAGKKVYNLVRDFYEDLSAMHSKLLNDQISNLNLTSDIKQNLLAKIKTIYEVGDKIVPYFALMRRGDYWLRVGSGDSRQFYMFDTPMKRDRAARTIAERSRDTLEALEDREVMARGNDVSSLRSTFTPNSPMLTELFDLIDNISLAGLNADQIQAVRNDLKDAIYQLYLISMPEQRLRKQFIHREGITGFSTDLMQNFSDSASGLSMQLSRIKYAPQIRNSMSAAQESISGQPNLEPFVEEMDSRVELELGGGKNKTKLVAGAETVVNVLNRGAFVHYLSSASSALLQPLSIMQFGMPILGARYGYGATAVEFTKLLKVWNSYGISTQNADGSADYSMPSMRNAPGLTPLERRAMDAMMGRNVGTATLTSELLARGKRPTDKSLSTARRYMGNTWWFASGGMLMHAAERLSQEMMFAMSFRLNRRNALKKFLGSPKYKGSASKLEATRNFDQENFQKWIDRAVMDTHESLANMTQENRPPLMRNFVGQGLTQFMMFPLHNNILLGKNFKRMIAPLPDHTRTEAAKIFFGIMATTTLVAGTIGLGIGLTVLGFLSGMWKDWWEDEDKKRGNRPEGLRDLSFIDWYKASWLPNQIGGFIEKGTAEGKKTIDELSALIARGGMNAATGADFSSRLGVLNLGSRDLREGRSNRESVGLAIESMYPPSLQQGIAYADAINLWMSGDKQKATEKAAFASARSIAMTYRLATEGAETTKGERLMSADSISKGELIWRAVGFNSDKLADTQATNYRINQIEKNIDAERNGVLGKFKDADKRLDMKAYAEASVAMNKFNIKYPWVAITGESRDAAVQGAREERAMSFKGVRVTDKNINFAMEAIAPSRREILRAEQKAMEEKKKSPREWAP